MHSNHLALYVILERVLPSLSYLMEENHIIDIINLLDSLNSDFKIFPHEIEISKHNHLMQQVRLKSLGINCILSLMNKLRLDFTNEYVLPFINGTAVDVIGLREKQKGQLKLSQDS